MNKAHHIVAEAIPTAFATGIYAFCGVWFIARGLYCVHMIKQELAENKNKPYTVSEKVGMLGNVGLSIGLGGVFWALLVSVCILF